MFCQKKNQKTNKPTRDTKNQIKGDIANKITSKNLSGVKKTSHWLTASNLGQAICNSLSSKKQSM